MGGKNNPKTKKFQNSCLFIICEFLILFSFKGFGYEPLILVSPHEKADAFFGSAVLGIPDMDGDGAGDFLVGELYGGENGEGKVYLFSGKTRELIREFDSPTSQTGGWFYVPTLLSDIDKDGMNDIAIGAPREGALQEGRVHVFSGKTGNLIYSMKSPNEETEGNFGCSVSGTGDLNGDGIDDILVGACGEPDDYRGRAYAISGRDGKEIIYTLKSPQPSENGFFGVNVLGATDLNGDQVPDFLISSDERVFDYSRGKIYAFSGKTGEVIHTINSYHYTSLLPDLNDDNTSDILAGNIVEEGAAIFSGKTGYSIPIQPQYPPSNAENYGIVSTFSDMTGDGIWDFAIGAPEIPLNSDEGNVFIYSGKEKEFSIYNSTYWRYPIIKELVSPNSLNEEMFGLSLSGIPDVNGDGLTDLIVSDSWETSPDGKKYAGRVYIYYTEPCISGLPTSRDFGRCSMEDHPAPIKGFSIRNYSEKGFVGLLKFTGNGIELTGPDADHFQFASPVSTDPIPYYERTSLSIHFAPFSFGPKSAFLRVTTNVPDQPVTDITLTGMCSSIWVEPLSLKFGEQDPKNKPSSMEFTIKNYAPEPLEFTGSGIEITGADASEFSWSDEYQLSSIKEGETRNIKVLFHPSKPGAKTAALKIHTSDPFELDHEVKLSGHCFFIPERAIYLANYNDFIMVYPATGDRDRIELKDPLDLTVELHGIKNENDQYLLGCITYWAHYSINDYKSIGRIDKKTGEITHIHKRNYFTEYFDFAIETSGTIVAYMPEGLIRIYPETGESKILATKDELGIDSLTFMDLESDGNLLMASNGIKRYNLQSKLLSEVSTLPIQIFALDKSGFIVAPVIEDSEPRIVRIDPQTGIATTISDNQQQGTVPFSEPTGIAVDYDGTLLVIDSNQNCLFRIDPETGKRWIISSDEEIMGFDPVGEGISFGHLRSPVNMVVDPPSLEPPPAMLGVLTPYGDFWGATYPGIPPLEAPWRRGWPGFHFTPEENWFPLSGNANGSGLDDIIQVTQYGDAWVSIIADSLSYTPRRWGWLGFHYDERDGDHGWYPLSGDANRNGLDDLIQVTQYGDAWVSLSTETTYAPPARWGWLGFEFSRGVSGENGAIPLCGDANGDGMDDLIQITRYTDAWVALSEKDSYSTPTRWGWLGFKYAPFDGWLPLCGDVDADGLDDLVQITPTGDPWVALSEGSSFHTPMRWGWLDFKYDEILGYYPMISDINADGKMDLIQITPAGEAWVAYSLGDRFDYPEYWGLPYFLFNRQPGSLPFYLGY